jgi:Flp pilus assembly pilin Flp
MTIPASRSVVRTLLAVLREECGATLAEYALVSVTLGLAMLSGVFALQTITGRELAATAGGWLSVALTPP